MASGEINRILRDFEFVYQDGTGADELWQPYFDFAFDAPGASGYAWAALYYM